MTKSEKNQEAYNKAMVAQVDLMNKLIAEMLARKSAKVAAISTTTNWSKVADFQRTNDCLIRVIGALGGSTEKLEAELLELAQIG
jgi:hypothetical protein